MVGGRQHLIRDFCEKLLASLALAGGAPYGWLAAYPLALRDQREDSRLATWREIVILGACLLGSVFTVSYPVVCLGASLGLALFRSRLPNGFVWNGAGFRNLIGFVLLGYSLAAGPVTPGFLGAALLAAFCHLPFVMRMGEPGLLIPGTALAALGSFCQTPWLTGAGIGFVLPAGYMVSRNLGDSWTYRAMAATAGAAAAAWLPGQATIGFVLLAVLSLETWRFLLRFFVLSILKGLYRFRILGEENIPYLGPGVVMSNHVSLLDGWLLGSHTQRMARFLVYDAYYKNPISRFWLKLFRTIPISQGGKREVIESLREARRRLEEGHVAGIFPEGSVTRSGWLNPFQKGITRVVQGAALPVVPAYMHGLWMSLVSFSEGGFQLRLPRGHHDLEIEFGPPMDSKASHVELWDAVKRLEVKAAFRDAERAKPLAEALREAARKYAELPAVLLPNRTVLYRELADYAAKELEAYHWGLQKGNPVLMEREGVKLSAEGVRAAAHAVRRVVWMKPGVVVANRMGWESSAALLLGLWTPLLYGAAIRMGDGPCDFEIQAAGQVNLASAAKHIFVVERPEAHGEELGEERCLPVLECAELSGVAALSSPLIDVAGEAQGGVRKGYIGRLLFGVEARLEDGRWFFRSPQRCYEEDARRTDWVAAPVGGIEDFGMVERRTTSSPRTS
jgi:1-acyl-sn-glycerol-3-phosphate acyltransferase